MCGVVVHHSSNGLRLATTIYWSTLIITCLLVTEQIGFSLKRKNVVFCGSIKSWWNLSEEWEWACLQVEIFCWSRQLISLTWHQATFCRHFSWSLPLTEVVCVWYSWHFTSQWWREILHGCGIFYSLIKSLSFQVFGDYYHFRHRTVTKRSLSDHRGTQVRLQQDPKVRLSWIIIYLFIYWLLYF